MQLFDISEQQFNVLRILRGQKGIAANLSTVQERMVHKMSNTTRLIDKLIQKKLVKRNVCIENRRKIELFITEDGLDFLKKIDPITQVKDIILNKKYAKQSDLDAIEADIKIRVAACEKFAEESPYPDKSVMYDAVYEQTDYPFLKHKLS